MIRKIIPYILIIVMLVGFFGLLFAPMESVSAQTPGVDQCYTADGHAIPIAAIGSQALCTAPNSWHGYTQPPESVLTPAAIDSGSGYSLGCSLLDGSEGFVGCFASLFFMFWQVSAWIAHLAGSFLDFFVYYSTNSSSYSNEFVSKAWGAIRDIANIFFIVALLYVAIKTVLSLDSHGGKKLIANIIIVALIINFSLFATKVVIDASNILAKVFYNNITPKGPNGEDLSAEAGGQKSISIGLIDKFNPQQIVTTESEYKDSQATFIFITLLALAVTLYTAYMFFAVALLFVARVVSLWLAMIFSPLAFVSYTVPFDIPGFGHREWWSDLLKNAFLAPLFIFFLYTIVLFTGFLKTITVYPTGSDTIQKLMSVVIPFVILMVLLMKAKKLAVDYSGKMGEAVMTGAKLIGGLALGAATGGAALMGTGVIGGLSAKAASSAVLNNNQNATGIKGWASRMALRTADYGRGASFDVRSTAAGKSLAKATGLNIGEAAKGGYEKRRAERVKKHQERAKQLEVRQDEGLQQNLNEAEQELQRLKRTYAHDIETIDKQLLVARQNATDATLQFGAGTTQALAAGARVQELRRHRSAIKDGDVYTNSETGERTDYTGARSDNGRGRTMNELEDTVIPHAHDAVEKENRNRKWGYAERLENSNRKTIAVAKGVTIGAITLNPVVGAAAAGFFLSQVDKRTDREAVHNIRMEAKIEKDHGDHGGGGHGGGGGHAAPAAHAPAAPAVASAAHAAPAAHAPATPAAAAPAAHGPTPH